VREDFPLDTSASIQEDYVTKEHTDRTTSNNSDLALLWRCCRHIVGRSEGAQEISYISESSLLRMIESPGIVLLLQDGLGQPRPGKSASVVQPKRARLKLEELRTNVTRPDVG
jgi:hypothetical protein